MITVRFWGVRGSVPSPIGPQGVEQKIYNALQTFLKSGSMDASKFIQNLPFHLRSTYGGNTSCVEIIAGTQRIVCDMGTGIRELGTSLFGEIFSKNGISITFLLSHMHWDHIQGLPFFGPLYMNKETGIRNHWHFYGGTNWMKNAEQCLRGQMDPPTFPVSFGEIEKITEELRGYDVYDQMTFSVGVAQVTARKLNHPQETYGWRIDYQNATVVYATDNEPYDPRYPDPRLLSLAKNADLLIIDCQYSKDAYEGKVGGVPRHGWGHSYPDAVAQIAVQAGVKKMVLFHHDPASSDEVISAMSEVTQNLVHGLGGSTKVLPANEGLVLTVGS